MRCRADPDNPLHNPPGHGPTVLNLPVRNPTMVNLAVRNAAVGTLTHPKSPARRVSVLRLPDLASTFRYMVGEESAARGGRLAGLEAVRGAFYRGDIAHEIARFHAENDGWLYKYDYNVDTAKQRLAFADQNITIGRNLVARPAGSQTGLVDAVRAAESALGQARTLLDAIDLT